MVAAHQLGDLIKSKSTQPRSKIFCTLVLYVFIFLKRLFTVVLNIHENTDSAEMSLEMSVSSSNEEEEITKHDNFDQHSIRLKSVTNLKIRG